MDNELIIPVIHEDVCPPAPEFPIPVNPPSNEDISDMQEECLQCWLEGGDI